MPTVPVAERRVQEQGLPNFRAPTDANDEAFGAGPSSQRVTQSEHFALDKVGDVAHEYRMRAVQTQVEDHTSQLLNASNELKYGEDGAYKKKGQNALGVTEDYTTRFQKKADEIGAGLTDDLAKAEYKRNAQRLHADLYGDLERHTFTEGQKYEAEARTTALNSYLQDATLNYQAPGKIEEAVANQHRIIDTMRGEIPDLEMAKKKASSKTYEAVLGRMLTNGQDQLAEAKFKEWRPMMLEEDAHGVEHAVEIGSTLGKAQRFSDDVVARGLSQPEALAEARKIEEPKLRKATADEIENRYTQSRRAQKDEQDSLFMGASNQLLKSNGTAELSPTLLARLPISERNALAEYARDLQSGKKAAPNSDDYYSLKSMASLNQTRDAFLQENLVKYRGKVTDSELHELIGVQASLRKGDGKAEKQLDGYRSDKQIVESTLKAAGINPSAKSGTDEAKRLNQFQSMVDEQVSAWKQREGKANIPTGEMQKIVDGLLTEGVVQGSGVFGFFPTRRKAFETKPGEKISVDLKNIPRSERNQIEGYLRSKNKKVTDDSIMKLYNAWKGL